MDIVKDTTNLQSEFLLEHPINFDNLDNASLNHKLESIFYNLKYNNNSDIKLIQKKNLDSKNILILFDYFFTRLNDIITTPLILEKRNDIFKLLSEILINNLTKIKEKKEQEKIAKFFYNLNFTQIFLDTLNKIEFSLFKENFALFLEVSLNLF